MELIKCPLCGEMYSPSYRSCPFCEEDGAAPRKLRYDKKNGRHVSEKKKTHSARGGLIVVLIVVLLILTWYLFGEQLLPLLQREAVQPDPIEEVTPEAGEPTQDPTDPTPPVIDETPQETETGDDGSGAVLSSTDFTANVGESVQLSVSGTTLGVTWSSENTAVATVDRTGVVKAVGAGTTNIHALVGTRDIVCIVRVSGSSGGADTSGAALNKTDFTASVGESVQLRVTGTSASVIWSINNTAVATISGDGVVKGVSSGMTTAYAKVGDKTLQCIVRIK